MLHYTPNGRYKKSFLQIFGKSEVSRALPLNRSGDVFFSDKIDVKV